MKLNFSRIFTREEPVAGLEVSESFLRLTLIEKDKKTHAKNVVFSVEEPLAQGVISGGAIGKSKEFAAAIQGLVKTAPVKIRYVIASIPGDEVYSKVFSFPKTISGQKLEESMKLTVGFQLPVKADDVYLDWEKVPPAGDRLGEIQNGLEPNAADDRNEIFLACIEKPIINEYINALTAAGLNPVAIEFHPLSFARVIETSEKGAMMIKVPGKTSTSIYVIKDRMLRFARSILHSFVPAEKIENESRKIKDFYEAEYGPIAKEARIEELAAGGKWLISLGAAMRGSLPRADDDLVSLMPVGTERAYEYHKAIIFSEFISNLTVGISIFFAAAFVAVWIFMMSVQQKTLAQLEASSSLPLPSDAAALESRAENINDLLAASKAVSANSSRWSEVLSDIKELAGSGISVKNVSLPSLAGTMTMSGTANSRDALTGLKKNFAGAAFLSSVAFAQVDLNQAANIPFSVSFTLRDPQTFSSAAL